MGVPASHVRLPNGTTRFPWDHPCAEHSPGGLHGCVAPNQALHPNVKKKLFHSHFSTTNFLSPTARFYVVFEDTEEAVVSCLPTKITGFYRFFRDNIRLQTCNEQGLPSHQVGGYDRHSLAVSTRTHQPDHIDLLNAAK